MTKEVVDGFGGGGRGRGRGNNGGGRGNNGGNRDGDNSFGFPIADEETHTTMKKFHHLSSQTFMGCEVRILKHFYLSLKSCAEPMTIWKTLKNSNCFLCFVIQ